MEKKRGRDRSVKAAETTFSILETLQEENGLRLTEIADRLEMANSTVHRYLQTLLQEKYIVQEDSKYFVGLRFLTLGQDARTRKEGYTYAKEKVIDLAEETDEGAQFSVEEYNKAVIVWREMGDYAAPADPSIGVRTSLHATATGKAMLAEWSDEKIDQYINQEGLSTVTPRTITTREALFSEIKEIREQGYSINNQESMTGLTAVGVSLCYPSGEVLGALSISGPTHRLQEELFERNIPHLLLSSANEIELNLS